jgi:hypothetical protein
LKKFQGDVHVWLTYIDFARKYDSHKSLGRIFGQYCYILIMRGICLQQLLLEWFSFILLMLGSGSWLQNMNTIPIRMLLPPEVKYDFIG